MNSTVVNMYTKAHQRNFDKKGGVKLNLVYPIDNEVYKNLAYYNINGNIEAHLANFGKY